MSGTSTKTAIAVSFLQGLFGSAFGYGLLWTMPDKASYWFPAASLDTDAENIAALVDRLAPDHDLYLGVSVFPEEYGPDQRGKSAQAAGIPALWLDLDLADPVHAKTNLPATEEEALSLFTDHGLPAPTIVIHSGHGLQLWWLFREPWLFEDQADQQRAAGLAVAWQRTIRGWALQRGWTVDSTADLSRVMRLPGTLNLKDPADVRPVLVRSADGPRYNPSDFADYLSTDAVESTARNAQDGPRMAQGATFTLDLDAQPPFDKFEALRTNSRKFRQTWDRKRADFPSGDYSASSYDLALADLLAQAEWSDQEIVDTCLAWRRRHNELDPKKALRVNYWQRVVGLAHEAATKVRGFAEAAEAAREAWERASTDSGNGGSAAAAPTGEEEESAPEEPLSVEEARRRSLEAISKRLGMTVDGVYRLLTQPPEYLLSINGTEFPVGKMKDLLSQMTVRVAMGEAGMQPFTKLKGPAWDDVVGQIIRARIDRPLGVTDEEKMAAWLEEYLKGRQPMKTKEAAWVESWPYYNEKGRLLIFFTDFFQWASGLPDKLTQETTAKMLKGSGAKLVHVRLGGRTGQQRRAWMLPLSFAEDAGAES